MRSCLTRSTLPAAPQRRRRRLRLRLRLHHLLGAVTGPSSSRDLPIRLRCEAMDLDRQWRRNILMSHWVLGPPLQPDMMASQPHAAALPEAVPPPPAAALSEVVPSPLVALPEAVPLPPAVLPGGNQVPMLPLLEKKSKKKNKGKSDEKMANKKNSNHKNTGKSDEKVANKKNRNQQNTGKSNEKAAPVQVVADSSDDNACGSAVDPPPSVPPSSVLDPLPLEVSLKALHKTKYVRFLGYDRRIVLQDTDGPCSLISICNYLILTGMMNVGEQSTVSDFDLANMVYDQLFPKLEDADVKPMLDAVIQSATGLDVNVTFASINGFEDSKGCAIFRILNVPLYHGWLLNPKDDASIINAIRGRTHDEITKDLGIYNSLREENHDMPGSLDQDYELIRKFLKDTCSQLTDYGLSSLHVSIDEGQLCVLFRNNHFSVVYKHNQRLYNLLTDEGYLTSKATWQRIDSVNGAGPLVSCSFDPTYDLNSSKTFLQQSNQKPPPSRCSLVELISTPSSSLLLPGSSSSTSSSSMGRPWYGTFLMEDAGKLLERKVLAFLRGYEENSIPYYKGVVQAMKEQHSTELRIHHDHIRKYDVDLADALHIRSYNIQKSINSAARTFIHDFEELDFECTNPIVRICNIAKSHRWMPLKEFLCLPGNQPAEDDNIYCGDSFMPVRKSTVVGRVILSNVLVKMCWTHNQDCSWDGRWSVDDVMVNCDTWDIEILKPYCARATRSAMHRDFIGCARELLPQFVLDGRQPVLFKHLDGTLCRFIPPDHFCSAMKDRFQRFITTHNSLRPPLANLSLNDDIYSFHHGSLPRIRILLQAILNSEALPEDWRSPFMKSDDEVPAPVPSVLRNVYNYNKDKLLGQVDSSKNPEAGDVKGKKSLEGVDAQHPRVVAENERDTGEPFNDNAEGQMICARHVRYHGPKRSKGSKGGHRLARLSHLQLILSHYFWMLPAILERVIYSDLYEYLDPEAYLQVKAAFEEILQSYNRPESPFLKFL